MWRDSIRYGIVFGFIVTIVGSILFVALSMAFGTVTRLTVEAFVVDFLRFFVVWTAFGAGYHHIKS